MNGQYINPANLPPLRPPPRPHSPSGRRSQSSFSQTSLRSSSSLSTTSNDSSQKAPPSLVRGVHSPYNPARPSTAGSGPSQSTSALNTMSRSAARTSVDGNTIKQFSPGLPAQPWQRFRQHSQGFFEPSLPHATNNPSGLSASQIAAQAAMHNVSPPIGPQDRKRSYPTLSPINTSSPSLGPRKTSTDGQSPRPPSATDSLYHNGLVGGSRLAATAAANVAFPSGRSPLPSPSIPSRPPQLPPVFPHAEKEQKSKGSKMKLFSSRPKNLNLSKDKEGRSGPVMLSPSKSALASSVLRNGFANASTTSLVDPSMSGASSLYSTVNASTSTLVPTISEKEKEKEKKHNFLSRQKNKLNEGLSQLPLSSAHSNSQPTNPGKPQPLYSFTPDSPGATTFAKSMSGFDLRHAGRALREKKKEEKAAAAAAAKLDLTTTLSNTSATGMFDTYPGPSQYDATADPTSATTASLFSFPSDSGTVVSVQAFNTIGEKMGLPGIGPDDAWPLLKARLLNIFSGEDLRTPVEDLNMLVSVHIRRCIQRKSPIVLVDDLRELLQTGFVSLAQTLRGIPDDRLVLKLVEMWTGVYGSILPYLQAVFLPLDLEFKGCGVIMSVREAQDFWGAMPESLKSDERPDSAGDNTRLPTLGEELDVRRITLICFRDTVILPKHQSLMAIFSRLSLDSINAGASPGLGRLPHQREDATTGFERPGTADSLNPNMSSFNSQGSTLLDAASSSSGGLENRSRAASNTSAGSFGTNLPHLHSPSLPGSYPGAGAAIPPMPSRSPPAAMTDPAKVTDAVARMLQCLYVVGGAQTGDVGQGVVERLTGALKYNWLGRGRTGRDRRGWVGKKNPPGGPRMGLVGA